MPQVLRWVPAQPEPSAVLQERRPEARAERDAAQELQPAAASGEQPREVPVAAAARQPAAEVVQQREALPGVVQRREEQLPVAPPRAAPSAALSGQPWVHPRGRAARPGRQRT